MLNIPPGAAIEPPPHQGSWTADDPNQELFDRLRVRPLINLDIRGQATAKALVNGACLLVGWALRETSAAAAADLYDGGDTTGELVASIAAAAAAGAHGGPGQDGVLCLSGLYFNRLSGTWQGSIWVRT